MLHCRAHYLATRAQWNAERTSWGPARRAPTFVYLNKTCFNGLWRVNRRAGEFNVPLGNYINPPICVPDALHAAQAVLARTTLTTADYRTTVRDAVPGDLIYFDPPYEPLSATAKFTSYTPLMFDRNNQRELAETARQLVARGCHVVLSNSDTPFIRGLYSDFRVDSARCRRSINSSAEGRGEVGELIIVGSSSHERKRLSRSGEAPMARSVSP